jgi:hypothetical protein
MRVGVEKRHIDSYKSIAREANSRAGKQFAATRQKYERTLSSRDISAENKKKRLHRHLHELIINTFSAKVSKSRLDKTRSSMLLIRSIIQKIKTINSYVEESLLRELGVIKTSMVAKALKSKHPEKYLEKERGLSKEYVGKIEYTVYRLMYEIVFFDEKLIKDYRKKEARVTGKEKIEIKDLSKILITESELLDALEAKIPPPSRISLKLFNKENFNSWVPWVFALLASFESEYQKEQLILAKVKKNSRLRKKIDNKIKHVIKEKERMLKLKEKRVLLMSRVEKGNAYRQLFREYVSAAGL